MNLKRLHAFAAILIAGISFVVIVRQLHALGTYAEGRMIIKLIKFESGGLLFESWEGKGERVTYKKDEQCDEKKSMCFTPVSETFALSVRTPDDDEYKKNARIINFMRKNQGRSMLIFYRIHRVEPASLSSSFEVTDVFAQADKPPDNLKRRLVVEKTGSRNFSVYGRILRLEYRGTAATTFEGLYLDKQRGKVHPFSVDNTAVASFAYDTMFFRQPIYMGVSQSLVTSGLRDSDYDFFEINLDEEAGGQ